MPQVKFVIDKELDFENHLIGLRSWEEKQHSRAEGNEYLKKLSGKSRSQQYKIFEKANQVARFYSKEKAPIRKLVIKQVQEAWDRINNRYFKITEKVHGKPFPYKKIYGVISTDNRFGYGFYGKKKWFAVPRDHPLFAVDVATHELWHAIFNQHYYGEYRNKFELDHGQMWAIKEAYTVLLNIECDDLRYTTDGCYPEHKDLREKILKLWRRNPNFEKNLDQICEYVKNSQQFSLK